MHHPEDPGELWLVRPVLEGDGDEDEDQQEGPDDKGHHPVAEQRPLQGGLEDRPAHQRLRFPRALSSAR